MSAPSFVNSATAAQTTAGTSLSCNVPASVSDGDLLITAVGLASQGGVMSTPSGWTRLIQIPRGDGGPGRLLLYARIASSEPASYSWTVDVASEYVVITHAYRPSSGSWSSITDAIAAIRPYASRTTSSATQTVAEVELPATMDMMLVAFMALSRGSTTTTQPTGYTMAGNPDSGGTTGNACEAAGAYLSVSNGSAAATSFSTTNSGSWASVHMVVKDPATSQPKTVRGLVQTATAVNAADLSSVTADVPYCASGDLLVAFVSAATTTGFTAPSGWSELVSNTVSGANHTGRVYTKVSDGTEGESLTWTLTSGTSRLLADIVSVAEDTAIRSYATADDTTSDTTWSFPAITSVAQSPVAVLFALWQNGTSPSILSAYPSGYSRINSSRTGTGAGDTSTSLAFKLETGANPAGGSFTGSGAETGCGFHLSTAPATAAVARSWGYIIG